jgi:hypothetical protein
VSALIECRYSQQLITVHTVQRVPPKSRDNAGENRSRIQMPTNSGSYIFTRRIQSMGELLLLLTS